MGSKPINIRWIRTGFHPCKKSCMASQRIPIKNHETCVFQLSLGGGGKTYKSWRHFICPQNVILDLFRLLVIPYTWWHRILDSLPRILKLRELNMVGPTDGQSLFMQKLCFLNCKIKCKTLKICKCTENI